MKVQVTLLCEVEAPDRESKQAFLCDPELIFETACTQLHLGEAVLTILVDGKPIFPEGENENYD